MILREKDGTTRFEVTAGRVWTVGRDRSADVVLPSLRVDKNHAVLDYRGPDCLLSDAGSSSGTFLNDVAVREPTPIKPGDVLRIGAYSMVVETMMDAVLREFADRMPADASLVLGFMGACVELQRQVEAAEPADAQRIARLAARIAEMARRLAPIAADAITHAGEHYSELAAAAVHVLDQTRPMASDDRLSRLGRLGLSHLKDRPEELKKALQAGSEAYDAEVERWRREMDEEEKNSQGEK